MANKPVADFDPSAPFTTSETPEFDATKPFEVGGNDQTQAEAPAFDPSKPFDTSSPTSAVSKPPKADTNTATILDPIDLTIGAVPSVIQGAEDSINHQGGWGLSDETRQALGADGPVKSLRPITDLPANLADLGYRGYQAGMAGIEGLVMGADSMAHQTGLDKKLSVDGNEFRPGSALMALMEAFPLAGHELGGLVPHIPETGPQFKLSPEVEQGYIDLQKRGTSDQILKYAEDNGFSLDPEQVKTYVEARDTGKPVRESVIYQYGPDGTKIPSPEEKLSAEAKAFTDKKAEAVSTPLEKEAADFTPSPEPTVEDLFKKPDTRPLEERLQDEASAFQAKKADQVEAPAFQEDKPFTVAEAPKEASQTTEGPHIDAIKTKVDEVTQGWKNAPEFEVVDSVHDIKDPEVRAQALAEGADKDALGFYGKDGIVRIIGSNIKSVDEVPAIVFHEALGHHGLASKFGDGLKALLQEMYDNSIGGFKEAVDKWMKDNPTLYKGTKDRHLAAAEEVLAEKSENGSLHPSIVNRLTNYVKAVARKMGIDLKYSRREIDTILAMSHDATVNGIKTAGENGFRYARRKSTEQPPELKEAIAAENAYREHDFANEAEHDRAWDIKQRTFARYHRSIGDEKSAVDVERDLINPSKAESERAYGKGRDNSNDNFIDFDPTDPNSPLSKIKFARRRAEPDETTEPEEILSPKDAVKAAEEGYVPETRSWAEVKQSARDRGFTAKEIRNSKSVGELDKRLYQYDQAAKITDEKLAKLNKKSDAGTFTMKDKADYLETVYGYSEMLGRIMNDQAEIGRALNAMKLLKFTKDKIGQLNELLKEHGGDTLGGFADEETFNRFMAKVRGLQQTGNPAGANALIRQTLKPYWWQYALTVRHSMMLSGLATHAKNIMDNGMMIARELEEKAMALPGGVIRDVVNKAGGNLDPGVSPTEVSAHLYGLIRAGLDGETWSGAAKAFKEGHGNHQISSKVEMADAKIPILSKVGDALHAQDVFFRSFLNNASLYSQGVREAESQGLKGLAAFQDGSNRAINPSGQMLENAKRDASVALLVDKPLMQGIERMKQIRPGMTAGEQTKAAVANLVFPFFRVTDRLLFQKIRRSPLSFLDRVTREDFAAGGARRDIAIARTAFGSYLIYHYWKASQDGKVEGDKEYHKQQALEAGGYMPNSVNDGSQYTDASQLNLSFNPFDLHNSIATNIASIQKAWAKKQDPEETSSHMKEATKSLLSILGSNSFAQNLSQYLEPFHQGGNSFDSVVGGLAGNMASSFTPAMGRQLNGVYGDTNKRDSTGDKSITGRIEGRVESGIPGLSKTLPLKYDVYGRPQETGKTLLGMTNNQKIDNDPTVKELQRLERTQDNALVTAAPQSIGIKGTEANLTGEGNKVVTGPDGITKTLKLSGPAYAEFQRVSGWYFLEGMKRLSQADGYKSANDIVKKMAVKALLKEARSAAKDNLYPETQGDDNE